VVGYQGDHAAARHVTHGKPAVLGARRQEVWYAAHQTTAPEGELEPRATHRGTADRRPVVRVSHYADDHRGGIRSPPRAADHLAQTRWRRNGQIGVDGASPVHKHFPQRRIDAEGIQHRMKEAEYVVAIGHVVHGEATEWIRGDRANSALLAKDRHELDRRP